MYYYFYQVLLVGLDQVDQKAGLGQLAFQDQLELLDLKVLLDCLVILVSLDQPENKVSLELQVQLDSRVRKVVKEILAGRDLKASSTSAVYLHFKIFIHHSNDITLHYIDVT